MNSTRPTIRSILAPTAAKAVAVAATGAVAAALSLTASAGAATQVPARTAAAASSFSFNLVPSSSAITACLPHAAGPANAGFDLFVIQQPTAPFGVSWYQTDIHASSNGSGSATVRGVFNVETFSVSLGGTTTFSPTHQYHLGVWFNNPSVPFNLGCEPGATSPIVTPFNGAQNAGIQVVNTSEFPVNAGPLSHVHR
jgi:hypothetical protein